MLLAASIIACAAWALIIVLPWQPHRMREHLEALDDPVDLSDVTVLIPARNEARVLYRTLTALAAQGPGLDVVVVDDESTDETIRVCAERQASLAVSGGEIHEPSDQQSDCRGMSFELSISCVHGQSLPGDWSGKLWALQQGLSSCNRRYALLLDADIELSAYTIPSLLMTARTHSVQLLSIMARLRCVTIWEKLLVPPFIFFFKLLYPFALVQERRSKTAAAAGGCVLVETSTLKQLGGFEDIRAELIDDCSLAARFKRNGHRIWLGVSHSVRSLRSYSQLRQFWSMVDRTAFTQLDYSFLLLILTTLIMMVVFVAPIATIFLSAGLGSVVSVAAIVCMLLVYAPTVRFYDLPLAWALTLPLAALLYLAMTWSSAINYWRGTRARWKNRTYDVAAK